MYRKKYPNFLDNQFNLFLFISRAHNTVNKRLDKPRIESLQDCLKTFKSNVVYTSPQQFRIKYLNYLTQNWSREQSGEGYMRMAMVNQMKKINDQYWNLREIDDIQNFTIQGEQDVLETILQDPAKYSPSPVIGLYTNNPNVFFGFKSGKLKLSRR
jgi:hypothetical protein